MKSKARILTVGFSVLLLSMVVTSCGEQKTPFDEQFKENVSTNSTKNSVEFKGIISKNMAANINTNDTVASYLIKTDDGKEIFLDSTLVVLDKYLGKSAIVRGYFKDSDEKVLTVLDAIDVDTANTDAVSETKIYTSEPMGIEFSYPTNWVVSDVTSAKIQALSDKNAEKIFDIQRKSHGVSESIDGYIKKTYPGKDVRELQLGTILGKSVVSSNSEEQILVVDLNGNFYTLHYFYAGKDIEVNKATRDFSELLNSLQFFKPGTKKVVENANTNENKNKNKNENGLNTSTTDDASSTIVDTMNTDVTATTAKNVNVNKAVKNENQNTVIVTVNTNKNEVKSTAAAATTTPATTGDTTAASQVLTYVQTNTSLLPATEGNTPKVLQMEFAGKSYVYVTYQDGDKKKKVLYTYGKGAGDALTFKQEGLFEQGDKTTWVKLSGQNVAASTARDVYDVKEGSKVEKKATVNKGMNLYTNKNNNYSIQYPRDWYYQVKSGTGGATEEVTFSNKPHDEVTDSDKNVVLKVFKSGNLDLKSADKTTIGGKEGYVVTDKDGNTLYAVKGKDGRIYAATVPQGAKTGEAMVQILGSVE